MPPFIPRKRPSVSSPATQQPPSKRAKLADVLDAESSRSTGLQRNKTFSVGGSDDSDSDSSLSDVDSDHFENVPAKTAAAPAAAHEHGDDEDEEVDWEDAAGHDDLENLPEYKPQSDGPIEITLRKQDVAEDEENWLEQAAARIKKAASKRDKQVRICAHQLHVQFLLWHNALRNKWVADRQVQQILVSQLPPPIKKEVDKWKRASGLAVPEDAENKKSVVKGRRKGKQQAPDPRRERDWGRPSERLEKGKPDMSNGDPLIALLKVLAAYWKKNFSIIAPGLRKRGHGTAREVRQILQSLKHDEHNPEHHGERIRNLGDFRESARKREGSRDVGAQLFTALLRGLGIEARLVASLQPCGYGWTKVEQFVPKPASQAVVNVDTSDDDSESEDVKSISLVTKNSGRWTGKGATATADSSDSDADDDSVVEVLPTKTKRQPQKYDRDHPFPIYWTEAISPITNKVLPVSPLVFSTPVATTPEILATFEPRGVKAEKTKTVMAYVVAHSSDGTAKDVTVRYLRKHVWPGKTKGFRYPVEKIPIYNKHGKVKRYEEFDWFKRVMSFYVRPDLLRTAVDDIEDATDLVPQQSEQKAANSDVDTLQSLKASADCVLERFLRREEALRPGATVVRTFVSGKGDNLKEEPVYLRRDVERCLTAESWHKEGRRPKAGETPMKLVPVRAVTITRKREAEEHERMTGEKQMQGLYALDQTEFIIPPPIVNGVIPKNAYGNIDCFVPSMVPKGAVHIPLRGTVRICKRLEIDFAEAVTGFEFGNKRAVPVCTGVVVAKEHVKAVQEAWQEYNDAQKAKEEKKLEGTVLEMWRKFVVGLRIRERVRDTYGDAGLDELGLGRSVEQPIMLESDRDDAPVQGGGFIAEDESGGGGGFLPDSDEDRVASDLEVELHPNDDQDAMQNDARIATSSSSKGKERAAETEYPTPSSVSPRKPALRRQRPGKPVPETDEDDEDLDSSSLSSSQASDNDSVDEALIENKVSVVVDTKPTVHGGEQHAVNGSASDNTDGDENEEATDSDEYRPRNAKGHANIGKSARSAGSRRIPTKRTAPEPAQGSSPNARQTRTRSSARKVTPRKTNVVDSSADEEDAVMQDFAMKAKAKPEAKSKSMQKPSTPKATNKRRLLRKDSTIVTSPYFGD